MSTSQRDFTDYETTGQHLLDTIVATHPEYASLRPEVYADVLATNVANARAYHHGVLHRRRPSSADLAAITEAARRRLHQGVTLEALMRSYRIGARAMWAAMREARPDLDAIDLADWTLQWIDWVSSAAESAYLSEQARLVDSQRDRVRLLVTRVVEDDFVSDLDREAALEALGLRTDHPHVVAVAGSASGSAPDTDSESLVELLAAVTRSVPRSVGAVLRRGAVMLVPASSSAALAGVIDDVLARLGDRAAEVTVGLGRATPSAWGLAGGVREAERARALGSILSPGSRTHTYDAVEFFDLFSDDGRVDEFVQQVLGPHLNGSATRLDLLRTLYVYFTLGMNRTAAARRVGIHPNTLDYRLRRAGESYGADLTSPEYSFRFQLAVRLLPLCQAVSSSQLSDVLAGQLSDDVDSAR